MADILDFATSGDVAHYSKCRIWTTKVISLDKTGYEPVDYNYQTIEGHWVCLTYGFQVRRYNVGFMGENLQM